MFPTRTFHKPEMSYVSIPPPPPPLSPYEFDISVNHSWEFLVVVCLPGSQNLHPISDQCCYNITCRVVTRMDIYLVQCRLTLVNWNLPSVV